MSTLLQAPSATWPSPRPGTVSEPGTRLIPLLRRSELCQPLVLALVAVLILFTRLDTVLLEPDEGRYAELPRLMNLTGDYLTPRLGGKAYNDKPPLVYWLIAGSYQLLGTSAASARLVMALMALLTVLATYLWARTYLGLTTAFVAGIVLTSMVGFVAFGRMLLLDSTLAACVVAGLFAGHHALAGPRLRWGWWLLAAGCVGLGTLAKGPVAGVLVFPALFVYRWLDPTSCRWGWRPGLTFVAVVLAIMLPWYVVMLLTNDTFFSEHIVRHHVMRFVNPYHHKKPIWFYGPALFVEMLPWSGVGLAALAGWRTWSGPVRLAVFASTFGFLFFSAAGGKLPTYLLPLLPLNAVLVSHALIHSIEDAVQARRQRWLVGLGVASLIVVVAARGHVTQHFFDHDLHPLDWFVLAAVPLTLAGMFARLEPQRGLVLLAGAGIFVVTLAVWHVIPDHADQASRGMPAGEMARWADQAGIPVVAYRGSWEAASFYRGRQELQVFHLEDSAQLASWMTTQERALILVRVHEGRLQQLLELIPPQAQVEKLLGEGESVRGVLVRRR